MNTDYQSIFHQVEETLLRVGSERLPVEEIRTNLEPYRHVENKRLSDDEYFRHIVSIIFYSGFKAATVNERMYTIQHHLGDYRVVAKYGRREIQAILSDQKMIRHPGKVEACVHNARVFVALIEKYGSFKAYIQSFAPQASSVNLMNLRADLRHRFKYLGKITTFHLMTEIGLPVLKPDRVIRRIFYRLGLIESDSEDEQNLLAAIEQGRQFSAAVQQPIRYIDIVFVALGQVQSDEFGLDSGICLKDNPKCSVCGVKNICRYSTQRGTITSPRSATRTPPAAARPTAILGATPQIIVGPYLRSRIVLCSGDAGPRSQLSQSGAAGRFFPGGKWVGAMRNAGERLDCRMAVLTTKHGLVEADTLIEPYDLHIHANREQVRENWQRTVPRLIDQADTDIVIFHAGGCPTEYVDELRPILQSCGVALLIFGRPNMADIGKVDELVGALEAGATLDALKSRVKYPTSLRYFPTDPALATSALSPRR